MARRVNSNTRCHRVKRGITNDIKITNNLKQMIENDWKRSIGMSGKAFNLRDYLSDVCNRRSIKDEDRYKLFIGEDEKKEIADKLSMSVASLNRALDELLDKEYIYRISKGKYILNFELCGFTGSILWKEYHKLRLKVLKGEAVDMTLLKGKFDTAVIGDNKPTNTLTVLL